ncbi:MAG TPA: nuclear transport factor 2 family protein [Chryseosolibacter sp.]
MSRVIRCFTLCTALLGCAAVAVAQQPNDDEMAIRAIFADFEKGYNDNNPDMVMQHYSKDLIVSYPGVDDTDYEGFKKAYAEMAKSTVKKKTTPVIDEIVVSGTLAMVRMEWHTIIYGENGKTLRKAEDLQIFRKENGAWKFFRGMWFHLKPVPVKE